MSMNLTPAGDRIHISIFGNTNAGKSSLINAITGQDLAIVSDVSGTTTDPVFKAMELLPLGPVMIADTPGLDDRSELGDLRIQKTKKVLNKTDMALIVIDANHPEQSQEETEEWISIVRKKEIPYLVIYNKMDELTEEARQSLMNQHSTEEYCFVSSKTGEQIHELKQKIGTHLTLEENRYPIVKDLVEPGDIVVLVVPIDKAAPKGRLILPQQQTIRDLLDANAMAYVTQDDKLTETLASLKEKPKMVITDSQAFARVSKDTPEDIMLTSFSILFARHKGELSDLMSGVRVLSSLTEKDKVLISEGCTHHRQCGDIGTVKIPMWLEQHTGKKIPFETSSGTEFPEDLSKYSLIIHCGGCMLNEREMKYRIRQAKDQGIPIVNYGIFIAYVTGILERSLSPFPAIRKMIRDNVL